MKLLKSALIILLLVVFHFDLYSQNWDKKYDVQEGYFVAKKDEKFGLYSEDNKEIYPMEYQWISNVVNGMIILQKDDKYGVFTVSKKEKIENNKLKISRTNSGKFLVKDQDGTISFYDSKTKKIKSTKIEQYWGATEGLRVFKENGKYGFLNDDLEVTIPAKYDDAFDFKNGKSVVVLNGKEGIISKTDEIILPIEHYKIKSDENGFRVYKSDTEFQWYDKNLKKVSEIWFEKLYKPSYGVHLAKSKGKYGYVTKKGEIFHDFKYSDAFKFNDDGYAIAAVNGFYGVIGKPGYLYVGFRWKKINFCNYGFKCYKDDKYFKLIGTNKEVLTEEFITKYYSKSEDMAVVQKDNKYGYMNHLGKITIPIIYDDAFDFKNGKGKVIKDGKTGYVFKDGEVRWTTEKTNSKPTFAARTGKVGMKIPAKNVDRFYTKKRYCQDKMISWGDKLIGVGQRRHDNDKPAVITIYKKVNQTSDEMTSHDYTYKNNARFRDVCVDDNNNIIAGGDDFVVVYKYSDGLNKIKELDIPNQLVTNVEDGGDNIVVITSIDEFRDLGSNYSEDERNDVCYGLTITLWNYSTGAKFSHKIVDKHHSKYQHIVKTKDGNTVLAFSAISLKENDELLGVKNYLNFLMKFDAKSVLSSKSFSSKIWLTQLEDIVAYGGHDLIEDRNQNLIWVMEARKKFGVAKISKDGKFIKGEPTDHMTGEQWARYSDDNEYNKENWFDLTGYCRAFIMEDPYSDGYIVQKRFDDGSSTLINEEEEKLFACQAIFFYINPSTLKAETFDFITLSSDKFHSGYSKGWDMHNASTLKACLFHKESGKFILTEQWRNIDGETSNSYSFRLNIWMFKPLWDRNWVSGKHNPRDYIGK